MKPFSKAQPLFLIRNFPITITGLVVLIEIIGMLLWVISGGKILAFTSCIPQSILNGELWRLFTYPVCSPLGFMSVLGLCFFYRFGSEVEEVFEQKEYATLILSILSTSGITLVLCQLLGLNQTNTLLYGSNILHLALFCAFCVMHPNLIVAFLKIPIKWFALATFSITILSMIASRSWGLASSYIVGVGLAIWMVQCKGLALIQIFPNSWSISLPKSSVLKTQKKKSPLKHKKFKKRSKEESLDLDTILDKISASGLHSLTPEERTKLEESSR